jgi:DNA-binding IclR family transcriptional regulator
MTKTLGAPAAERDKRSIQSIQLGFRIVDAVMAAGEPMTLSAISRAVDMAPGKATLYVNSFCAVGLLVKDSALRYRLGPYALKLGLAALNDADVLSVARDEMPRLRTGKILAVYLSVWGSLGPVIVGKDDKHPQLAMTIRLGHVLPLLTSATGHVYLAYLPAELTAPVLQREQAQTPLDTDMVEKVRKAGFAALRGHVNSGVIATAAPVLDRDGSLAAVLTVLSPRPDGKSRDAEVEKLLLQSVRSVSAKVGGARALP